MVISNTVTCLKCYSPNNDFYVYSVVRAVVKIVKLHCRMTVYINTGV